MGCLTSKPKERPIDRQQVLERPLPCYDIVDQVAEALAQAGLVSSNLIVGIDFTKSNEWNGKYSFLGLNLHHTDYDFQNPYEHSISIIAHTLSTFNNNLIPCYGFGDESTQDEHVFSFYPDDRPCNDLYDLICRYRELTLHVKLAGPTSFAPIIEMAMTIVENSGGQYHVLLIIADGQVTRSADTDANLQSPQEQETFDALTKASEFPLSILLVGVGDGPWDMMKKFDDPFPQFKFVNFTEIMSGNLHPLEKEAIFASTALSEIPSQCVTINGRGILGRQTGRSPNKVALPPPRGISYPPSPIFSEEATAPPYTDLGSGVSSSESSFNAQAQQFVCPICWVHPKDMAFGCGHRTCVDCSHNLDVCPICRHPIQSRLRLYN